MRDSITLQWCLSPTGPYNITKNYPYDLYFLSQCLAWLSRVHFLFVLQEVLSQLVSTLRLKKNVFHFMEDIFKWIFVYKSCILIKISLKFAPNHQIINNKIIWTNDGLVCWHVLLGECKKDVAPLLKHWSYLRLSCTNLSLYASLGIKELSTPHTICKHKCYVLFGLEENAFCFVALRSRAIMM